MADKIFYNKKNNHPQEIKKDYGLMESIQLESMITTSKLIFALNERVGEILRTDFIRGDGKGGYLLGRLSNPPITSLRGGINLEGYIF